MFDLTIPTKLEAQGLDQHIVFIVFTKILKAYNDNIFPEYLSYSA